MLLPHRTAWTTQVEFQAVYSDLFESDGDSTRQQVGLSRIAVWQARNQCPSAIETTANLLRLILLDTTSSNVRPSAQELRLSYSMALIRFVNSLVDPLQTAYFARSISSLAAQLGLPLWFVELRHQATHEDLPGLPVLREGARQALDWLYVHYWQPTITNSSLASTSNSSSTLPPLPLEPFVSSLQSYKALLKSLQKDASQAGKIKNELVRVYRDLERWGIENGVSTSSGGESNGKRARKSLNPNGLAGLMALRTRERAMETVAGLLVDELGWLVPLAKKKRPSTRLPSLPKPLIELYSPLLEFLDETLFAPPPNVGEDSDSDPDSFIDTLIARIVDILCSTETAPNTAEGQAEKEDPTIHLTLQAWLLHLLPLPAQDEQLDNDAIETIEGILKTCLIAGTPSSISVIEAILARTSDSHRQLSEQVEPLLRILRTNNQQSSSSFVQGVKNPEEAERVIEEILRRSAEIEIKLSSTNSGTSTSNDLEASSAQTSSATANGSNWSFVSNFKPSPIGSLPISGGGFEGLDLVRS